MNVALLIVILPTEDQAASTSSPPHVHHHEPVDDTPFYHVLPVDDMPITINTGHDNENSPTGSHNSQKFLRLEREISMKFSAKGLNKTNGLKLEHSLKKTFDSLNMAVSDYRMILKIEQIYTRLSKRIAKKQAIVKRLNDNIAEDNQHLQKLAVYYNKKLKNAQLDTQQRIVNGELFSNINDFYKNRILAKELINAASPSTVSEEAATLSATQKGETSNQLMPGHFIYLLTLTPFTCTLCVSKFSGSDTFILDCCRQHLCSTCYSKCKTERCPFCRRPEIIAFNFYARGYPTPVATHYSIDEHTELIDLVDDFDDEVEIYNPVTANEFAEKHFDDMARCYAFAHM